MKFLHSADWQLGKPYGRFEPNVRAALTEARFDAIDAIGRAAVEHGVSHVLVAGDIFDTEGPEDRTIVQAVSRKGARRDYVEGFSLTEAEYQLIREELSPESRKFLVKQGHDSVVVELDLTGLDNELAVLSGRAETTPIAVQAAAEFGPDPANWLPVFHQRRRPS